MVPIYFVLLLICVLRYSIAHEDVTNATVVQQPESTTVEKHKWILQLFQEAKIQFNLSGDVNDQCKRDFNIYQLNVVNQTIWAIRMMESSEWPGLSLFAGATTYLGNWEECLRSRGPANIQGRYCLADATYDYKFAKAAPIPHGWDVLPPENASAWEVMKMYENIASRKSRRSLTWAICIPSSCQSSDLENVLNEILKPIFEQNEMSIEAVVKPIKCQIETENIYSPSFYYTLMLIFFIFLLIFIASVYDTLRERPNSKNCNEEEDDSHILVKLLLGFSAIQNWKILWRRTPNVLGVVYSMKVFGFILIVIAHEALLSYSFPRLEAENAELIYKPFKIGLGFHGVVDLFMVTSGFLTFHFGVDPTKKYGFTYVICAIIFRWLRLIPAMGLVMLFFVNVMPYFGDGPFYNTHFLNEVQYCSDNWWTNLLAINNIVNRREMCLPSTWYIAVDFQLTIVAGLLLFILSKNYYAGLFSIFATIAAGMTISAYVIATEQLTGLPLRNILEVEVLRKSASFTDNYMQIYSRVGPYFVGGLAALLLNKLNEMKWKPPLKWVFRLILASGIGYVVQLYGFILLQVDRPYYVVENVVYGIVHRIFYILPVVTIYVLLILRRVPIISDILEWRVILLLGRLAYGVFLCSVPIQFFYYGTFRQILNGSQNMQLLWRCCSDILTSLIAATILFYMAEGPVANLTHSLQQWATKSKDSKSPQQEPLKGMQYTTEFYNQKDDYESAKPLDD